MKRLKGVKGEQPGENRTPFFKSLGTKLFFAFFCGILIAVIVVGTLSYQTSKSTIKAEVAKATEQTLNQTTSKMDMIFANYEATVNKMMLDSKFRDMMSLLEKESGTPAEQAEGKRLFSLIATQYVLADESLSSVSLIPVKEGKTLLSNAESFKGEVKKEEWQDQAIKADGMPIWMDSRMGGYIGKAHKPTYGMARLIRQDSREAKYILVLEIKSSQLRDSLKSITIGESGHVVMVNGGDTLIEAPNLEDIGKKHTIELPKENAGLSGSFTLNQNGQDELIVYSKSAKTGWFLIGSAPTQELLKSTDRIFTITVWVAFGAAIIAILIGYVVGRLIGRSMARLRDLMREGEQGNLTVRMPERKTGDEISQVGISFNRMMERITTLVRQTNDSAKQVLETAGQLTEASRQTALSAKEIAAATEDIAGGASSLASAAENGNDLTSQMGDQMKFVIQTNLLMAKSAGEVQRVSMEGSTQMNGLSESTDSTEKIFRALAEKIKELKESSSSIHKILEVLGSITKQTNILSLNATIEAARAGTAGKGFMVVADEIRQLADQSKQSIQVVGEITSRIQKEMEATTQILNEAYPVFAKQTDSVNETTLMFETVRLSMDEFVGQLDHVYVSIQELEQSQDVLAESMANVSAVAEQSSATSEEVASLSSEQQHVSQRLVGLSEQLQNVSRVLEESLSKFKV
ncbi:hypothetical protein ABB08_09055 [Paenibacillus larvae]|nr:hypothetical protein [Paenibacillus larvae]